MTEQVVEVTQEAKAQGTKKRTGFRPNYVVTLSDEDEESLASVMTKRSAPKGLSVPRTPGDDKIA